MEKKYHKIHGFWRKFDDKYLKPFLIFKFDLNSSKILKQKNRKEITSLTYYFLKKVQMNLNNL